jgi:hypothetical protein
VDWSITNGNGNYSELPNGSWSEARSKEGQAGSPSEYPYRDGGDLPNEDFAETFTAWVAFSNGRGYQVTGGRNVNNRRSNGAYDAHRGDALWKALDVFNPLYN